VSVNASKVELAKEGMGLTLNGIAQGYISDRIASLLRRHGFAQTLVQVGETVAQDPPSGKAGWRVALDLQDKTLTLANKAVATSAPGALTFDGSGCLSHIINPHAEKPSFCTAQSESPMSVSVIAAEAMVADALSTGLQLAPVEAWPAILQGAKADYAIAQYAGDSTVTVPASK